MSQTAFALVLHGHLPYVRPVGPEELEERWLYEAVAETYLPLLWALERLQADGVPARLTLSLSGPLLSMLGDAGLMERCRVHMARMAELAAMAAVEYQGTDLERAAVFHRDRFVALAREVDAGLVARLAALERAGLLELVTAVGTHPILPLLGSDRVRRAHLRAGVAEFERHLGRRPRGIWLPECAYAPGLEHLLAAEGIDWFVADGGALAAAFPAHVGNVALTPGGVAAFGRDPALSAQVWDSKIGYPGDPVYREFYRDVAFDWPLERVAPFLVDGRVRSDSGVKLYRVTGEGVHRAPYDPEAARLRAEEHARHFAGLLQRRAAEQARQAGGRAADLVVAPFDAELFGHWWFEGPWFIEALFRELARDGAVRSVTPSDWLAERRGALEVVRLPASSWGEGGDYRVWADPEHGWVWPELHAAEAELLSAADRLSDEVLNQAVRELLLAESSDWTFLMHFGQSADYAQRRVQRHLARLRGLVSGEIRPSAVAVDDGIFPALDGRAVLAPGGGGPPAVEALPASGWRDPAAGPLRVLMLTWEFPPHNVGGLGRHVYDLGAALVRAGHEVVVLTLADDGVGPGVSYAAGMEVHRVPRPEHRGHFLTWVYQINLAFVDAAGLISPCDVVHSHDWLAGQAGMALKARWGAPLVATIHATEKGRNGGIREPMQQAIHEEEWLLAVSADQVITVSQAMAGEVAGSFWVEPTVIYNGVDTPAVAPPPALEVDAPYFFYIGRLVVEKGVQVAISALAQMQHRAHLVVAGKGPMETELKALAVAQGVGDRVHFLGRVSDEEKASLLQHAAVGLVPSLYEPFGIVALEVMAAGAPVVVGDTGGLAEIVTHQEDGLKVPPGDVRALARALDELLGAPERARALAKAGRRTAQERFGWTAIAEQTVEVYRRT